MAKNDMMVYALALVLLLAVVYYFKPSLFNFMKLTQGFEEEEDFEDDDDVEGFEEDEEE